MITINGKKYKEVRCSQCQKFIVNANILAGDVFYQCPKCGYVNEYTFKFLNTPGVLDNVLRYYSITKTSPEKGGE
jgi:phage FluMu protein Com